MTEAPVQGSPRRVEFWQRPWVQHPRPRTQVKRLRQTLASGRWRGFVLSGLCQHVNCGNGRENGLAN